MTRAENIFRTSVSQSGIRLFRFANGMRESAKLLLNAWRKKGKNRVGGFERRSGGIERLLKINLKSQRRPVGSNVYKKYTSICPPTILQKSQNPKVWGQEAKLFKWTNFACVLRFRYPTSREPLSKASHISKVIGRGEQFGLVSSIYDFSLANEKFSIIHVSPFCVASNYKVGRKSKISPKAKLLYLSCLSYLINSIYV